MSKDTILKALLHRYVIYSFNFEDKKADEIENEIFTLFENRPIEDALREENNKLKEALKFYADKENWESETPSSVDLDYGKIAQEALK